MALELQEQKEREKLLIEEKLCKEEEVLMVETQYQGLQSEVDDMRQLIKNFRVRYKQAVNEIQDLNQEHAKEKIEHFEQVTNYEKELALYRGILKQVVSGNELVKIEQRCFYDEINTIW